MPIPRFLSAVAGGLGVVLLGAASQAAVAQEAAPLVLRLAATPRAFSLGRTYAPTSGPEAIFYSPANASGGGFFVAGAIYSGRNRQVVFANGGSFSSYQIGIFANWLDYGANTFPTRPGDLSLDTGILDGQSLAAGVSVNRAFKKYRIGATAKYIEERIADGRGKGVAWDLGISRTIKSVSFSLVARNLGDDFEVGDTRTRLPREWELGASSRTYPLTGLVDIMGAASLVRERRGRINPGGGVQFSLADPVNGWNYELRLGYRRTRTDGDPSLQPWTIGGSWGKDGKMLDYGFESIKGTGAVHRFGVRLGGR